MLQNAYFLAKIGADTAEIELHFAEMLPIGRPRRGAAVRRAAPRVAEAAAGRHAGGAPGGGRREGSVRTAREGRVCNE